MYFLPDIKNFHKYIKYVLKLFDFITKLKNFTWENIRLMIFLYQMTKTIKFASCYCTNKNINCHILL